MGNPFTEGDHQALKPAATALVIFGASGDLTHRKLVPALYNLAFDGLLPDSFIVVGASRTKYSDEEFRATLKESVESFSRRELDPKLWDQFSQRIFYQSLDGKKSEDFTELRKRLEQLEADCGGVSHNYLYYLATSPSFFGEIAKNLDAAGLVEPLDNGRRRTLLIVEKPFGHDLESARALNKDLRENFAEDQIYRIDHYLGKETVQNILVLRFANGIFEPLWNRNHVDHIQVSVCESIGVGGRAGYFDKAGIVRDVVQNHLLQMLALLCIEPPSSLQDADSIRDEKVKVLRAIRRYSPKEVSESVIRSQYAPGFIEGKEVRGYLQEEGIEEGSQTESYVAMRLEIDNWRWSGVPIYVRAGKRLPKRITEITVFFKRTPSGFFFGKKAMKVDQNVLAIQVQPDEGVSLSFVSKAPGPRMRVRPVVMDFNYDSSFGKASADAYERLLLDAMKADATLFTRDDEIEQAWDLLTPVFTAWNDTNPPPLLKYEAGSWGPVEADVMLARAGHQWRRL